jgi:hypothetical protein
VPDARTGKAVHLRDAEGCGGARGVLHPLGGPATDALRLAVAPHLGGEDRPVARVDRIAHGLADEVRAEGPASEAVPAEQLSALAEVGRVGERLVDLEVVAPARELEPVEAPAADLLRQLRERQVGPLAGEERDRTRHRGCDLTRCARPNMIAGARRATSTGRGRWAS